MRGGHWDEHHGERLSEVVGRRWPALGKKVVVGYGDASAELRWGIDRGGLGTQSDVDKLAWNSLEKRLER